MSGFYQSLDYITNRQFKARKKLFKKNKPCAVCGKIYPPDEMMVAHKVPVRDLSDWDALYDQSNWEVRCVYCEQKLNQKEDKERAAIAKSLLKDEEEELIEDKESL